MNHEIEFETEVHFDIDVELPAEEEPSWVDDADIIELSASQMIE